MRPWAAGRRRSGAPLRASSMLQLSEIANHLIYTDFVRRLCSRSSLIVALLMPPRHRSANTTPTTNWSRLIAQHKAKDASELMVSHIVDLFSGLDLSERSLSGRETFGYIEGLIGG